ncbi:MAG: hypothetical protein AB7G80_07555 [Dongiaceae bacterium]
MANNKISYSIPQKGSELEKPFLEFLELSVKWASLNSHIPKAAIKALVGKWALKKGDSFALALVKCIPGWLAVHAVIWQYFIEKKIIGPEALDIEKMKIPKPGSIMAEPLKDFLDLCAENTNRPIPEAALKGLLDKWKKKEGPIFALLLSYCFIGWQRRHQRKIKKLRCHQLVKPKQNQPNFQAAARRLRGDKHRRLY